MRAVKKWGRWEEDSASGLFTYPQWGYFQHYDPRLEVEWSYGSIFGERDINEHGLNWHIYWMPLITAMVVYCSRFMLAFTTLLGAMPRIVQFWKAAEP